MDVKKKQMIETQRIINGDCVEEMSKFPENSIASLREAIRLGCTGSEFDVRMTADEVLVISHDAAHGGLDIESSKNGIIYTPLSILYVSFKNLHFLSSSEYLRNVAYFSRFLKRGIKSCIIIVSVSNQIPPYLCNNLKRK